MSSILDENKIDGIAVDKDNHKVILLISDHLDWKDEINHLQLLQAKINAYISIIEDKQIYELYKHANNIDKFELLISFKYKPNKNCLKLLILAVKTVKTLNIDIKIVEPK